MYDKLMVKICNWCIQFLKDIASMTGLSYEEINVWLFIIIQPGLILLFFVLWRLEKKRLNYKNK
jgi:hypothetical protein|tara:strand:- start:227 stop:418 length:192 start_codon:yes stop_codon:yes gene_type:complete